MTALAWLSASLEASSASVWPRATDAAVEGAALSSPEAVGIATCSVEPKILLTVCVDGIVTPFEPLSRAGDAFSRLFPCANGLSDDDCELALVSCEAAGDALLPNLNVCRYQQDTHAFSERSKSSPVIVTVCFVTFPLSSVGVIFSRKCRAVKLQSVDRHFSVQD